VSSPVVTLLIGVAVMLPSCAVFATLMFLAAFGRIRHRPAFLLLLLPMFAGLALMIASNTAIVGNPF
jgi:hypothetical protein